MVNIGVIGCGHWGPNHIRVFSGLPNSNVVMCCDANKSRLAVMKQNFPSILTAADHKELLRDDRIDAVVISTPTVSHYKIVKEALESGRDVLCEKPLAMSSGECRRLADLALEKKRILMVGHVFLFNSGIRRLKEDIRRGSYGRLLYMHSKRTNLGPFRDDVNVIWDLASHDTSIFNFLLDASPVEVSAYGGRYLKMKLEDVAFISMVYPKDILVNFHVSWLDPKKVRQITVVGDKKMAVWDDLDSVGPIKLYDRKINTERYYNGFGEFQLLAKEGNILIPKLSLYEPLKEQNAHFIKCVMNRKQPVSSGEDGIRVLRILEAAQKSISKNGKAIRL